MTAAEEALAGILAIGRELGVSTALTKEEREKVISWTTAMGLAFAAGDAEKVRNYQTALSAMLGVAALRGATSAERALVKLGDLGLSILTKIALAAIA